MDRVMCEVPRPSCRATKVSTGARRQEGTGTMDWNVGRTLSLFLHSFLQVCTHPSIQPFKSRHSTNAHWRRLLCQARGERQTGQTCSSLFLTDISLLPWSRFSPCRDRHIAPWFHLSPTLATRGATQWNSLPKSTSLDQKALGRQPKGSMTSIPSDLFAHLPPQYLIQYTFLKGTQALA